MSKDIHQGLELEVKKEIPFNLTSFQPATSRVVRVGIDDAPPVPMQFGNPDTSDFRGYEVDLLKELSRRAGFELRYRRALWSVIISELVAGEIDLVCSAATITTARHHKVDFCSPHLDVTLAVVKRSGSAASPSLEGLRIGVRRETTAEAYVKQHATAEPRRTSESNDELYAWLAAGTIDAVVDDSPIAQWFSCSVSGLRFAGTLPDTKAAYAIMIRKGNDGLRAEIDQILDEIKKDGTCRALLSRWFGDYRTR